MADNAHVNIPGAERLAGEPPTVLRPKRSQPGKSVGGFCTEWRI